MFYFKNPLIRSLQYSNEEPFGDQVIYFELEIVYLTQPVQASWSGLILQDHVETGAGVITGVAIRGPETPASRGNIHCQVYSLTIICLV